MFVETHTCVSISASPYLRPDIKYTDEMQMRRG